MSYRAGHNRLRKWDAHTDALVKAMVAVPPGEVFAYTVASLVSGETVTCQHPAMRRALRVARDSHGAVFVAVSGEGYRRIGNSETATKDASRSILKASRAAKRGLRRLKTAHAASLTTQERAEYYAKQAILSAIKSKTHGNSVNSAVRKTTLSNHIDAIREQFAAKKDEKAA